MPSQDDLVCDFHVVSIYGFNEDSDGLCRTLKSQYYKNGIKNLSEQGILGGNYACTGAIAYVEYEDAIC